MIPQREKVKYGKSSCLFICVSVIIATAVLLSLPAPCQSHGAHHHHHHHHHDHSDQPKEPPSFKYSREANVPSNQDKQPRRKPIGDVFIHAMGSTLLISAAPFLILFFVPVDNSKEHEPLLKVLLSFASGGLLGDAFLHLIPHALPHDGHDPHNMSVGLCILGGIITFLLVEKLIRLVKGEHHHHHHHGSNAIEGDKKNDNTSKKDQKDDKEEKNDKDKDKNKSLNKGCSDIQVAGYLNLAADFLHNFTDGLAIGASYLAGNSIGYITTFTILLHEVPHEIGDFAILVQSGYNKPKAMMLQLVTAVGALLGTYISLLVGGIDDIATSWILPFTAGGFIYISTVSVIPQLLTDSNMWQSIKEIIALLIGVYMMVLVVEYEQ